MINNHLLYIQEYTIFYIPYLKGFITSALQPLRETVSLVSAMVLMEARGIIHVSDAWHTRMQLML